MKNRILLFGIMCLLANAPLSAQTDGAAKEGGVTALHQAVERGDVQAVRNLLAQGASVHAVTDFGETPLHFVDRRDDVPMKDKIEITKLLIQAGADVDARTKDDGRSALFFVSKPIAEVLVGAGADVDLESASGLTAIQWLAYSNAYQEIEYLISQGAEINYQGSRDGKSALHIAANFGNVEAARVLLEHGADVNLKDKDGWTPLQWAAFEGGPEMEKFLIDHGAKPLSQDELKEIQKITGGGGVL